MKKILVSAYALAAMVSPSFAQESTSPTTAVEALAAAAAVVNDEKAAVNAAEEAESLALATQMRKDYALKHLEAIEKELARTDKGASYKYTMYWEKFYLLQEQCYLATTDEEIIASLTALKTIMANSAGIDVTAASEMSTELDENIAEFYVSEETTSTSETAVVEEAEDTEAAEAGAEALEESTEEVDN